MFVKTLGSIASFGPFKSPVKSQNESNHTYKHQNWKNGEFFEVLRCGFC